MARRPAHRARLINTADDLLTEIEGQFVEGHYTQAQVDTAYAHIRRGLTILGYPHFRRETEEATAATVA